MESFWKLFKWVVLIYWHHIVMSYELQHVNDVHNATYIRRCDCDVVVDHVLRVYDVGISYWGCSYHHKSTSRFS